MQKEKDFSQPTIILNKSSSDDFLDFYNSDDLKEVIKVLNKIKK